MKSGLQILYLTHSIIVIEEIDVCVFDHGGMVGDLIQICCFVGHDELPLSVTAFGVDEKEEVEGLGWMLVTALHDG